MALYSSYIDEIKDNLNYVATWLPSVNVMPGDVCDMRGSQLKRVGNLGDFGISWDTAEYDVESDIHYASAGSVSIGVKLKGELPKIGSSFHLEDAGVSFAFARSGAVVLQLTDCTSLAIDNVLEVRRGVIALYDREDWPEGHVVVTQSVKAGASTIIVSSETDAAMELAAKGAIAAGPITLARLNTGLEVKSQRKIGVQFVSAAGLTPLVQTEGIRKRMFGSAEMRGESESAAVEVVRVHYDNF